MTAGLRNGLSRLSGNHHVRFLGEDAVERPHPYPTNDRSSVEKNGQFEDFLPYDAGLSILKTVPVVRSYAAELRDRGLGRMRIRRRWPRFFSRA